MQQWMRTLHSVEKIDLIHYCQGQGLLAVQKVCFNYRRMMLLERERTSPDEWRWYVTITSNKLFTRKHDDYNLYNENYFFQIQLTQKIPTSWTSSLTTKKKQMRRTLIDLIDSKEFIHEWINGWGWWGFIHITVTLGQNPFAKSDTIFLSETFFKPMKFFSGIPSGDCWPYNYCKMIKFLYPLS